MGEQAFFVLHRMIKDHNEYQYKGVGRRVNTLVRYK